MAEDLSVQLLSMQNARTLQGAQVAMMRKAAQRDQMLVQMIDETIAKAPAPAGTGRVVDKHA